MNDGGVGQAGVVKKINLENADIPAPSLLASSVGINYHIAAHHSLCMAKLPEVTSADKQASYTMIVDIILRVLDGRDFAFEIKTIRLILLFEQLLSIQWMFI